MIKDTKKSDYFYVYYKRWIQVYKDGAIRKVTMDKYILAASWVEKLIPKLKMNELNRITYQKQSG